jgi:hypothetical protein
MGLGSEGAALLQSGLEAEKAKAEGLRLAGDLAHLADQGEKEGWL